MTSVWCIHQMDPILHGKSVVRHLTNHLSVILDTLQKNNLNCCSFKDGSFNEKEAEARISNSIGTVAILTAGCLETKEMMFALQAASFHYKELSRIIVVHAAESCYFPVPPESVSKVFMEKAITWLSCYTEEGVQQIVKKYQEEKKSWENSLKAHEVNISQEDLTTRVFLRYRIIMIRHSF